MFLADHDSLLNLRRVLWPLQHTASTDSSTASCRFYNTRSPTMRFNISLQRALLL
jgi:hypothetical protein